MKISKITINNYKSIDEINISLESYGSKNYESKTMVLVGINECGKSNILEAIDTVNHRFKGRELDYESTYFKLGDKDINPDIDVYYYLDISEDIDNIFKHVSQNLLMPKEFQNQIKFEEVFRNFYLDEDNETNDRVNFTVANSISWFHYVIEKKKVLRGGTEVEMEEIKKIETSLIPSNSDLAKPFIKVGQQLLTKSKFENLLEKYADSYIEKYFPKIIYWKSTPEHLINDKISLEDFKGNPTLSLPLKNIFHIGGMQSNEEIKKAINRALKNEEYKSELEDSLTKVVTKHINQIWKEHKISFRIKFDGDICKVHVEDKSSAHKYYKMMHRSDGFKQFVSLILSLSAENNSNILKNNIILLDEPEVHLHPSGIRYMRDEILKIGRNNYLIVATHSHYLIDTQVMERHYIVDKIKSTCIKQLQSTSNFSDDEVVAKAFGFNLMKELIPKNIFLVEGLGEKNVFNHVLKLLFKQLPYAIKSAGGSKVYSFASLLNEEKINSIVVVDDDKEGTKCKSEILKHLKPHFDRNNVFTLKDILSTLPNEATLEDLYPIEYVNNFLSSHFKDTITLDIRKPIIEQIKNYDKSYYNPINKEKLNEIKTNLAEEFIKKYKTLKDIEKCARIQEFFTILIKNIQ